MLEYLSCARISEIIAKKCPSDKTTTARGPTGRDVKRAIFREKDGTKHDVVVFTIKTAKRHGKERQIALPVDKKYEPFAEPLFNYFKKFGNNSVFDFTRQKALEFSIEVFKGLHYPVERYIPFHRGEALAPVEAHTRKFRTHALRHLRASELLDFFDFSGVDVSLYGGWTLQSTIGVGSAVGRYTHLKWKKYFPKLLLERY